MKKTMHENNTLSILKGIIFENTITFSDDEIFGVEHCLIDNSGKFSRYKNSHIVEFLDCTFRKQIVINTTKKTFKFIDCHICHCQQPSKNQKILFKNCDFDKVDSPINLCGGSIEVLTLSNTTINNKFYINSDAKETTKITKLILLKIIFEKKFKLYNCEIKVSTLEKIDFNDDVDFKDTKFLNQSDFSFNGIQFHKLALFTAVTFISKVIFQKITFHDEGSFVGATFNKGTVLEDITIKKTLNFANVNGFDNETTRKGMTRETFRIIKHNFKKLNNKIDHNLFHSYELEARYNELVKNMPTFYSACLKKFFNIKNDKQEKELTACQIYWKYWSEKFIYTVHKKSSFFGTSWTLPLKYIFYVSLFTTFIFHIYSYDIFSYLSRSNFLQKIDFDLIIKALKLTLNNVVKFISIVYFDDKIKTFFKEAPWMFVIHKGALGYLYYQFIIALRKDTKN